jgi:hypothetical protein
MSSSALVKTLLGLWIAALLLTVFFVRAEAAAGGDDDDDTADDAAINDAGAAGGAGGAGAESGEKPLGYGLAAGVYFPKNQGEGRVPVTPAGQKVEALITITNAPGNPEYTAVFVAAQLHPLNDYSRFYQNFSGNPYKRDIVAGQHTTLKYTFTPDEKAEPMEFSLVLRVFIQPKNDPNSTFAISAYNATITLSEPLGTDPRTVFTLILIVGAVAAGVWYYRQGKENSLQAREARLEANTVEVARNVKVDADFLPKEHIAYLEKLKERQRSKSPKTNQ